MTVTEQDRERAAELCLEMPSGIDPNDIYNTKPFREQVAFVAAALADERERARAPFLALAAEIDERGAIEVAAMNAEEDPKIAARYEGRAAAYARAGHLIRTAAEESQ